MDEISRYSTTSDRQPAQQFGGHQKKKKIDHEGGFQGALLLQSTTKEGKFMADQVEPGSV